MNLNLKAKQEQTFDAIVVGSGISGGWAAKELSENGLKTLVLERGRKIEHIKDYHTATMDTWDLPNRGRTPRDVIEKDYPKQNRTGYTTAEAHRHFFVKDSEHPYQEDSRFDWMRGYHLGGRSITWGRQSYRLSDIDFESNLKEGIAVDWPVRYKDIKPWYDKVERFIGVSGENRGFKQLPDGQFLPPMELNCVEQDFRKAVESKWNNRWVTVGRTAHLTQPLNVGNPNHPNQGGRSQCMMRDRCMRGCPYGGYFSSLSSTLPAGLASGNLTIKTDSIVHEIMYDDSTGKATGVRVIDQNTKESKEYYAKVIFLCASAIASAGIMLMSKSDRFPNGLGNDSGELGHNIMDHHLGVGAGSKVEGYEDKYYKGRRANGIYIPRFRNLGGSSNMPNFKRGYGYQGSASREGWGRNIAEMRAGRVGGNIKDALMEPGGWTMGFMGFGETLPQHKNHMYLDHDNLDAWGLPQMRFDAGHFHDNEYEMRKDMAASAAEMLEAAGFKNVYTYDNGPNMGLGIHEMGTARMGHDPKTSVLNKWNQVHAVKNVFVTDGSFMTSAACHNPSLGYMAFSARAANYAADQLKKNNL
ncbi:GMC oxidoreductase [Roseivirga pacifica]|uniref:GMC oxidoreductase n=1 Tax=Roseivirga pacifica TaxID=1267423 RepID=UPI00227C518C|nr:GMC family oxidoreductase [Roseivirga pacifica]